MVVLLSFAHASHPMVFKRAPEFAVAPDQTLDREHWVAAQNVTIEGAVADDLFVQCVSLSVAGRMSNDVWALANSIEFTGHVTDHARFIGLELSAPEGRVGRGVFMAGNLIRLGEPFSVGGDATLLGEDVTLEGTVEGDALIAASSVTLKGAVHGDATILSQDIVILPGAKIGGDLVYSSREELFLDDKVEVSGQLIRKSAGEILGWRQPTPAQVLRKRIFSYIAAILTALPFMVLFPAYLSRVVSLIRFQGWKCMLTGTIACCLLPLFGLIAILTIVGTPIGLIALTGLGLMLYLCKIVVALAFGGLLISARGQRPFSRVFGTLAVGLLVFYIFTAIPYLSTLVLFAVAFLGAGGLLLGLPGVERRLVTIPPPPAFKGPPRQGDDDFETQTKTMSDRNNREEE